MPDPCSLCRLATCPGSPIPMAHVYRGRDPHWAHQHGRDCCLLIRRDSQAQILFREILVPGDECPVVVPRAAVVCRQDAPSRAPVGRSASAGGQVDPSPRAK